MEFSARERLIIDYLIGRQEELTIKELSKEIDVSPRTIHRDLNNIEMLLKTYNLELIRKTGVGIQVHGTVESKESLRTYLVSNSFKEFTLAERQIMILCTLYESSEPVKLFALAYDLGVSTATISSDLIKLEEQLSPFQLSILKKRGYGIEMAGTEKSKRRAISYMMAQSLKDDEWVSYVKQQVQNTSRKQNNIISERLLHLVDQKKLVAIEEVMQRFYHGFPFPITDNAYAGLIVHLTLAIDRIELGEGIEMSESYLKELAKEPEYGMARDIIDQLAEHFQIEIPEAEVGYITMHLQGAKLRHYEGDLLESSNLVAIGQVKKLIQSIEEKTGQELMNNEPLLQGLVTHLKPAIYRIRESMGIANPLLDTIRRDYEKLFQIVKKSVVEVFPELRIPDEEVGYLVMHFGSVLLSSKGKKDLKAYVVCSSGIGTSKMLVSKLQHHVSEIAEIVNISFRELNEIDISDRDLVISTIHLQGFTREYLIVNPIISEQEIEQVKLYARRQMLVKKVEQSPKKSISTVKELTERLNYIQLYAETARQVLLNFKHFSPTEGMFAEDYMRTACEELSTRHVVGKAESVIQSLFAREAMGGIGLPGTKLAFFHTRHKEVLQPSFTVYTLKEPIRIKGTDGTELEASQLLLLLAPDPFHQSGLEVLSYISTLLIESKESTQIFESGIGSHIVSFLAEKFEEFIREKIS